MHIFHNWQQLYRYKDPKGSWFKHEKCLVCNKQRMNSHIGFFATIDDAIDFGIEIALYKGFKTNGWDDKFDDQ